jgi:glucose/arabinose dehydrogenase
MLALLLACSLAQATSPDLPSPNLKASVEKRSKVLGWPNDRLPIAPPGFTVSLFAKDLVSPRWLYLLPNGDVAVAEALSRVGEAYSFESFHGRLQMMLRGLDLKYSVSGAWRNVHLDHGTFACPVAPAGLLLE